VTDLLGNQSHAATDADNLETHFRHMLYTINSGGLVTRITEEGLLLFLWLLIPAHRNLEKFFTSVNDRD
jgi:hypothetical protein